jgi:flavin-dependent dehydrogenase
MKAVVIGGGAAGMGAAWRLRKQGVEVVIVEKDEELVQDIFLGRRLVSEALSHS